MTDPASPPSISKCPYHHQQGAMPSGHQLWELATDLEKLMQNVYYSAGPFYRGPAVTAYKGELGLHPSLHNQGKCFSTNQLPILPADNTPLSRMIGDIHGEYRKAAYKIGSLLSIESLEPRTQGAIKRYLDVIKEYRAAVLETSKNSTNQLPDYHCLGDKQYDQAITNIIHELQESELAQSTRIPIKTVNGVKWIEANPQGLGLYLFTLQQAAGAQVDYNKLPKAANSFLTIPGYQAEILTMWSKFTQPVLSTEVERINTETYNQILRIIKREIQAVQMAQLMLALAPEKGRAGIRIKTRNIENICNDIGMSVYPQILASPLEAAVIIECVNHAIKPTAPLILDAVASKLKNSEELTFREVEAGERAFDRASLNPSLKNDEAFLLAQKLLMDYLEQYRAQTHPRMGPETSAQTSR